MGKEVASAYVTLFPSVKGFAGNISKQISPDVERAGKDAGKTYEKGAAGGIGRVKGALAGALIGGAAVGILKGFVSDARESIRVGKLPAQVVMTTGGAAHVTAGQVGELATAISNKTGVDDEAVQSASNLLLTFTNVRNEVGKGNDIFNQATAAAVDMAAVLGGDAASQSKALGKALNDPVKGITALSRAGVSFTEQQKKQIKEMVKSGDILGAQKIILSELGKEFGGAAAAAATPSERLTVTMGNLREEVGTALVPAVDKAATLLVDDIIPALRSTVGFVRDNATTFKILAAVVGTVTAAVLTYNATVKVVTAVTKAWTTVQMLLNGTLALNPIGLTVIALAAFVAGVVLAYKHSETFRNIVGAALKVVVGYISLLLLGWEKMLGALGHVPGFGWAKTAARAIHGARDELDGFRDGLNKIPAKKFVTIIVRAPSAKELAGVGGSKGLTLVGSDGPAAKRAGGGPLGAGQASWVGEFGKELWIPDTSGTVLNQRQIMAASLDGSSSGGATHYHEWNINNPVPERASESRADGLRRLSFITGQ